MTLESLSETLVRTATERNVTVGTAESLTAGLIAATIANTSGASRVLMGGVVSYDPEVKHALLSVTREVIDGIGVVSEPCARQMADGARAALHTDFAVSATGVAGPTGGTPETPVGTVYLGVSSAVHTHVVRCQFSGDRQAVREQAVGKALVLLIEAINKATDTKGGK